MPEPRTLRLVVASPGDVQSERGVMPQVVEDLNDGIAQELGVRLELAMWEIDAHPGFDPDGPQGLIDPLLRIKDCDILLGIFWKHFGTPTQDAESGTEHEFRTAYATWKKNGRPQIMVYFNQEAVMPKTRTEAEQWMKLLAFKEDFPKEGLWWPYEGKDQFEQLVRRHLTKVLRGLHQKRMEAPEQGKKTEVSEPAPPAAGMPIIAAEEALRRYRQVLVNQSRHMSLRSLDVGASDPTGQPQRLDLAQVYVDLLTTSQVEVKQKRRTRRQRPIMPDESETEPLSALKAVVAHRRVVLLGDPGSGKSTFVTHLGLGLAAYGVEPQDDWAQRLPDWDWKQEGKLVPLVCILRDFARWLPKGVSVAEPKHLWDFLAERLSAQNLSFAAQPLRECLEEGQAVLLLDGLDEVPTQQQRTFIRDAVGVFAKRYPRCRFIVTCRTLSYQSPDWQLADFESFTLAAFDTEQINRFIAAWYTELARLGTIKADSVATTTQHLQDAVQRPDLQRLASNPLLLTAMALVHAHKGRLPDARALLYEETVDILLWRWEQLKSEGEQTQSELRSLLRGCPETAKRPRHNEIRAVPPAQVGAASGADG